MLKRLEKWEKGEKKGEHLLLAGRGKVRHDLCGGKKRYFNPSSIGGRGGPGRHEGAGQARERKERTDPPKRSVLGGPLASEEEKRGPFVSRRRVIYLGTNILNSGKKEKRNPRRGR